VPHSFVCLQNQRKRLLWSTDGVNPRLQVRLDRARGNPVAKSDETRLRSHVRMAAQLPLRMAHSTSRITGRKRVCLARKSEPAKSLPGIFAVTAPSVPGKEGRFLLLLRRRRPKHTQNHFTRDARSINAPARNDQGDVVRDKRLKHLHQRPNTVPEFVQIQSQYNLNFAGSHQGVSLSRSVTTRTFSSQPRVRRNPTVSCQPDPAQKAKPHRDVTLLTPARHSVSGEIGISLGSFR
jgi:hypothetical protein